VDDSGPQAIFYQKRDRGSTGLPTTIVTMMFAITISTASR
jgi:hypothetical protein